MVSHPSAHTVVEHYLRTLERIAQPKLTVMYYPALVYPESLLDHPKTVIVQALNEEKETAYLAGNYKLVGLLDQGQRYLNRFIDDKAANQQNFKVLRKIAYWRGLR